MDASTPALDATRTRCWGCTPITGNQKVKFEDLSDELEKSVSSLLIGTEIRID